MGLLLGVAAIVAWVTGITLMVFGHFGAFGLDPTMLYTYGALTLAVAATITVSNFVLNALFLLVLFGVLAFLFVTVDAFNLFGLRGIV